MHDSSPLRICAVTCGFQTTTENLSVFPFLPEHYHTDSCVTITIHHQWRRNEFDSGAPVRRESGGKEHPSGTKRQKNLLVVPLYFLA